IERRTVDVDADPLAVDEEVVRRILCRTRLHVLVKGDLEHRRVIRSRAPVHRGDAQHMGRPNKSSKQAAVLEQLQSKPPGRAANLLVLGLDRFLEGGFQPRPKLLDVMPKVSEHGELYPAHRGVDRWPFALSDES